MIKCHLSRLMGERKMKIVDVARETGLHRNTITLLYNETATRLDIDAIDRLCKLFDCKVGDLFRIPSRQLTVRPGHGGYESNLLSWFELQNLRGHDLGAHWARRGHDENCRSRCDYFRSRLQQTEKLKI
jgi:putative transcriptional regulator